VLTLVKNNQAFSGFEADDDLNVRTVLRPNDAGGFDYHEVTDGAVAEAPSVSTNPEDSSMVTAWYSHDGKILCWIASPGRDTAPLFARNTATGKRTLVGQDACADVGMTLRHRSTGVLRACAVKYLKDEWKFLEQR